MKLFNKITDSVLFRAMLLTTMVFLAVTVLLCLFGIVYALLTDNWSIMPKLIVWENGGKVLGLWVICVFLLSFTIWFDKK
jgi:hypothetical protein